MTSPKLITLTLRTKAEPLAAEMGRLLQCFNRLRRHSVWQQLVAGGFYAVELTRNTETRGWHVHLHAVVNAKYIPQEWLSDTWEHITGDSKVVDIRRADAGTAKYLAAYVSKAVRAKQEPWEVWPVANELAGRRLAASFGNEPAINTENEEREELEILGRLTDIIDGAMSGDRWAQNILAELLTTTKGADPPDKPG